jgi:TatD DNase family protein
MLIDTHAHLTHDRLAEQLDAILGRAQEAGVGRIICATANLEESVAAAELAQQHEQIFCLAGVHPHHAEEMAPDFLKPLAELLAGPKCVGLGEIGLDYHYDFSPRPAQQAVFEQQLALAVETQSRIVIHTREAFDDTMAILRQSGCAGDDVLFHSFAAGPAEAEQMLAFGASISFSGIATFKNAAAVQEAVLLTPDDRFLIETDCPYLSPEPVRKIKTNEPSHVQHVAAFLSKLRNCDPSHLEQQAEQNTTRFFRLPE